MERDAPVEKATTEDVNILDAIAEILGEDPGPLTNPPQPPIPPSTPAPPPRVGTVVQRSDHVNKRKMAMLMTPPPPLAQVRRVQKERQLLIATAKWNQPSRPTTPQTDPGKPTTSSNPPGLRRIEGPLPPPPIPVEVEPGFIVEVPHFAVHASRRFKFKSAKGQWILRFTRDGRLRYKRRIR